MHTFLMLFLGFRFFLFSCARWKSLVVLSYCENKDIVEPSSKSKFFCKFVETSSKRIFFCNFTNRSYKIALRP